VKELRILELRGTARERGRQHGESLRSLVQEHRDRWFEVMSMETGLYSEDYLDLILSKTRFIPAIKRWTPRLLDEVHGIAEGANVDFRYALVRQLSDEEPWFRREQRMQMTTAMACSSAGVDPGVEGVTIIGQNMDCPAYCDGHQVLLKLSGPDMPTTVYNYSIAGKISLCGGNSAGLAICCNTLSQLDYSPDGLPEDFVVRGFLECTSLEAGVRFLKEIRHASGQNYTVAAAGQRVVDLEVSARSVAEYRPWPDADRVFHTNHPLANPDRDLFDRAMARALDLGSTPPHYNSHSYPRFDQLAMMLEEGTDKPTLADLKACLASHEGELCRHPDGSPVRVITLGCLLFELGSSRRLHIAPGPPCSEPFVTVEMLD
jgi:hypothetical protein